MIFVLFHNFIHIIKVYITRYFKLIHFIHNKHDIYPHYQHYPQTYPHDSGF